MDTRRGDVYAQSFDAEGAATAAPMVAAGDDVVRASRIEPGRVAGDGAALISEGLPMAVERLPIRTPDAVAVAALAMRRIATAPFHSPPPLYPRAAETSVPQIGKASCREKGG